MTLGLNFDTVLRLRILQRVLLIASKFEDIGYFFTLGHDLAKSKLNYLSLFCKYYCMLQITHQ